MVDGVEFGRKIKEIREAKHMSVRQVAIKADMSHSYLSTIENGRRDTIPSKKTLLKMAHGLNMSQNDIFKVAGFLPENIPNELPISSKPSTVSIPIYGRISAGYPEGAKEDIEGHVNIDDSTTIKEFNYNYYLPLPSDKHVWSDDDRYCVLVGWNEFISNPNKFIEKAYEKRTNEYLDSKVRVRP